MLFIISEKEKDLYNLSKNTFTSLNAEDIIWHEEAIIKFIWISQAQYRAQLALWEAKWEEEKIYNYVECLEDLKNQFKKIWDILRKHREKQQEKENK